MNLDTFFKKFDEFAEAPNAVQKMRELILELAVRGKLVEQDESDIRASALVDEILTEKLRLTKLGMLKSETSFPAVLSAEMLFPIPDSWEWVRLSDVTSLIQRGKSPDYVPVNGLPVISQRCVQWTGLDLSFAKMISKESIGSYETYRFIRDEDLLWNSTGTGTIGRIVRVLDPPDNLVCDSHVTMVRCLCIVAEYIRIWLRSASVYGAMETNASGSTNQIELTAKMAKSQVVPLPPLAEQKRIVAKVDELMALCDRLEAQEAERKEKKRRLSRAAIACFAKKPTAGNLGPVFHKAYDVEPVELRKVILELAVRGKLVEQQSSEDKAATIFSRGDSPSIKLDIYITEQRHEVPNSWIWVKFAAVGEQRLGKMLDQKGNRGEPRPYLRNTNVQWMRFNLDDIKFLRLEADELNEYRLRDGDLLICEGGEPGRCAIWRDQRREMYFQKAIHRVRPRTGILTAYLAINLRVDAANGVLDQYFTGATIKHFTGRSLADYSIPLPPTAEQRRIVAKVDELMALVDKLEAQQAQTHELSERLLDAAIAVVIEDAQREGARQVLPQTSVANEELREAFLISRIVSKASDPEHPLGRFRRTKFSYLAHRRAGDDVTKHYIKKAAGPYSPWAKFDGPEDMARARGYVQDMKADPLEGMVAGECVGEVEVQVTDPLIGEAVDWVMKNFHFETNDSLELLTTVDFAAVGLRKEDKEISREEIKKVIAKNKEWAAKLGRELFSDENIDRALKRMAGVFPEMYGK